LGGPKGVVKNAQGVPLEGMGVQLISDKTAIRTTVYSNQDGRYEFPKLEPGTYTFRIALPREYQPFVKEKVAINGATAMDDIQLTRVTNWAAAADPRDQGPDNGSGGCQLSGTGEDKL
jgi:hypothetical protein